jgi:hypothetical protein
MNPGKIGAPHRGEHLLEVKKNGAVFVQQLCVIDICMRSTSTSSRTTKVRCRNRSIGNHTVLISCFQLRNDAISKHGKAAFITGEQNVKGKTGPPRF